VRRFAFPLLLLPVPLAAQVFTSPAPEKVSVTVYRAPDRSAKEAMELDWLQGYALITETRTVEIPAGESTLRFEGVAGGILPESAIVTGLPEGLSEKNQDADLLSPRALLSAATGRRVSIRRTDGTSGKAVEEEAILRSGPDGAAVLQTHAGFEALQCSGLNEDLFYQSVPAGLSAKPTLSVRVVSKAAARTTITLSYLANGFDWQANYVAELAPGGGSVDLFAWVTLANGDETSFPDAETQAVAGKINREAAGERLATADGDVRLRCWPAGRTHQVPEIEPPSPALPPPPMVVYAPVSAEMADDASEIVVTSSRVARQEELGDLKLYRIPQPVTVASNSQKQVTMLDRKRVPAILVYRSKVQYGDASDPRIVLKLRNRAQDGLGVPLPAGPVAIFQRAQGRPMLLGESHVEDKAIGEEVEIDVAGAPNVTVETDEDEIRDNVWKRTLTVRNANPWPVDFEAEFAPDGDIRRDRFDGHMVRRNGAMVWTAVVAANGTAVLGYRAQDVDD